MYNLLQKVIHWWNIFQFGTPNSQGQLNEKRSLIPWGLRVCGLSLRLGSSKSCKTPEQKFTFQIGSLNYFLHITTHIYNPQLLQLLLWRVNARNVSFETLYGGQFTLSTQLTILYYPVILSHRHSTAVSLKLTFRSMNSQFYSPTLEKRSSTFSPVSADTSIKISTILFSSA